MRRDAPTSASETGASSPSGISTNPRRTRWTRPDLVVTPGFVDPHTHYDAQLFWDPLATPSSWHGVTSVIGGNCGFTIAPLKERDADYTRRLMERVEGMPLAALEQGVRWTWDSFGEFLDAFEGNIAVNAGFMVGHCALRRYVMEGDDTRREATPDELAEMLQLMHRSLDEGGLGLSTSRSNTHLDGDGQPVPSRLRVRAGAARAVRRRRRASRYVDRGDHVGLHRAASTTARSSCSRR